MTRATPTVRSFRDMVIDRVSEIGEQEFEGNDRADPGERPGGLQVRTEYGEYFEQFLRARDLAPRSLNVYRNALDMFGRWIDGRPASEREIIEYKRYLRSAGKSPYTINFYLTVLRSFFSWVERNGGMNCAKYVKGEKTGKGHAKEALTREQALDLLGVLTTQRDKAMVTLMIGTGLRTVEVSRANVEDVRNKGDATVLWIQGKGHVGKDDFVVLTGPVLGAIREYLAGRKLKSGDPLFTNEATNYMGGRLHPGSVSRIVREALNRAGIHQKGITAHSLRHSCATFALHGGATVQEVQSLLRHQSLQTTMIYLHNIDRINAGTEAKIMAYMGGGSGQ